MALSGSEHPRFALGTDKHADQARCDCKPQSHPHRTAHLTHCVTLATQLFRNQCCDNTGQAGKCPHCQAKNRNAKARCGKFNFAQAGNENYVNRMNQHLQKIGKRKRPSQLIRCPDFIVPITRIKIICLTHKAGPDSRVDALLKGGTCR
jgi:hypothetical protein